MSYRITSFNMRNFGNVTSSARNLHRIAEIIKGEKFDIVAMQEILAEGKGVKRLLEMAFKPNWDIFVSDIDYDSDPRGEQFAYI